MRAHHEGVGVIWNAGLLTAVFTTIGLLATALFRLDSRFDRIDARFDRIDARFDRMDARFDRLDERFSIVEATLADHLRLPHG
jgi:hypothetical protein